MTYNYKEDVMMSDFPDHKMKPNIKKKWVKALRSGEYEQVGEQLCVQGEEHDKFCCLGVLQDLAVREGVDDWTNKKYSMGGLTKKMEKWSGLGVSTKRNWFTRTPEDVLVELNDDHECNFKEIANWIEANL